MVRGVVLVVGTGLLAVVLFLLVGVSGLGFPRRIGWHLVVIGLPVSALFAAAMPSRWWHAAGSFVAASLVGLVGLAQLTLMRWPTDVRDAGHGAGSLCITLIAAGALLASGVVWLRAAARVRWVAGGVALLCATSLAAALAVMSYFRDYGLLPFAQGGRVASYDRLWRNLERFYARWDDSPVPLDELRQRYRALVIAADRECGYFDRCARYRAAIRDMLAELQDGHTHLIPADDLAIPPVTIEPIEGQAVITRGVGIAPGTAIRAIDGRGVAEALARVPRYAIAYTAPHTRTRQAFAHLLAGPRDTSIQVELEEPDGTISTVTLRRTDDPIGVPLPVHGRRLGPDLAYIAVPHLRAAVVVTRFDELLDHMPDVRGLVLDLRGNGGGWSGFGGAIVSRLITERVVYGRECFRGRHPLRGVEGCFDRSVDPGVSPFAGRLAVLLDGDIASSGEWMALALCSTGRARCFGATTAGDSGNPLPHFMPDLMLQFSTGDFLTRDGIRLNGIGVTPQVVIEEARSDVAEGRDPVLDAASRWLMTP